MPGPSCTCGEFPHVNTCPYARGPLRYRGEWVAVDLDDRDRVLAHSPDSRGLVPLVRALPPNEQERALVYKVPEPTAAWVVW